MKRIQNVHLVAIVSHFQMRRLKKLVAMNVYQNIQTMIMDSVHLKEAPTATKVIIATLRILQCSLPRPLIIRVRRYDATNIRSDIMIDSFNQLLTTVLNEENTQQRVL